MVVVEEVNNEPSVVLAVVEPMVVSDIGWSFMVVVCCCCNKEEEEEPLVVVAVVSALAPSAVCNLSPNGFVCVPVEDKVPSIVLVEALSEPLVVVVVVKDSVPSKVEDPVVVPLSSWSCGDSVVAASLAKEFGSVVVVASGGWSLVFKSPSHKAPPLPFAEVVDGCSPLSEPVVSVVVVVVVSSGVVGGVSLSAAVPSLLVIVSSVSAWVPRRLFVKEEEEEESSLESLMASSNPIRTLISFE